MDKEKIQLLANIITIVFSVAGFSLAIYSLIRTKPLKEFVRKQNSVLTELAEMLRENLDQKIDYRNILNLNLKKKLNDLHIENFENLNLKYFLVKSMDVRRAEFLVQNQARAANAQPPVIVYVTKEYIEFLNKLLNYMDIPVILTPIPGY